MASTNQLHVAGATVNCATCKDQSCFIQDGLTDEQLQGVSQISTSRGPYQPGETIFQIEDPFKSLYVVQSGATKIETVSPDGCNLVDGFYFRGDVLGLEAIGSTLYQHDAVALEETWLCELPYEHLESLCTFIPRLQHKILIMLGRKLRHMNKMFLHGRYLNAEERLMLFFRMLCHKQVIRKKANSATLTLTMSKGDIASYLGLRAESLSRALTRLQKAGLIHNHGKTIEFHDIDRILAFSCD
ncbi:MAG: cyclic nucleotide-binding domain-containing protein [Chromatiales bacterium]|nr:cyclic nucleotide-binding domain-containing protein [Chromatiales bacterium]